MTAELVRLVLWNEKGKSQVIRKPKQGTLATKSESKAAFSLGSTTLQVEPRDRTHRIGGGKHGSRNGIHPRGKLPQATQRTTGGTRRGCKNITVRFEQRVCRSGVVPCQAWVVLPSHLFSPYYSHAMAIFHAASSAIASPAMINGVPPPKGKDNPSQTQLDKEVKGRSQAA